MRRIKIHCGQSVDGANIYDGCHPVKQFNNAIEQVYYAKLADEKLGDINIYSNLPDFVSSIYYLSEKEGVLCELYLDGSKSSIEEIFSDWNRFYTLLDNEIGDHEN